MTVNYHAFADVPARAARRLLIDLEPVGSDPRSAWAIVVRGEDWHVVGRTNRPDLAELVWNDAAGDYVACHVASGARAELAPLAAGLADDDVLDGIPSLKNILRAEGNDWLVQMKYESEAGGAWIGRLASGG
jgi:hypothetical protein